VGEVPADRSSPVNPPETKVANCKGCPKVKVPEFCGFAPSLQPGSLGAKDSRRHLLGDGGDGVDGADAAGVGGIGGRRGLLARSNGKPSTHSAFQASDRKLSVTRQPDFKPPSDAFREEMVKVFKGWRDEDQCTMWTKSCIGEWNKNSSKVWGVRKGPANLFPGRVAATPGCQIGYMDGPY
jgi:hypothetical protein